MRSEEGAESFDQFEGGPASCEQHSRQARREDVPLHHNAVEAGCGASKMIAVEWSVS